jgi:ketosteroid isomerase-like protein
MKFSILFLTMFVFPLIAVAQGGPCTEQSVKAMSAKADPNSVTDDAYFFSGALNKPVVGKQAFRNAFKLVDAERKNFKASEKSDRVVVAAAGDMAYEYGTSHIIYDEVKNGKHNDFYAAYLRVWTSVDGACKQAAVIYEEVK